MTQYEQYSLALQIVVAITAFASVAFLYRQIKAMVAQIVATQEASRAQSVLSIVNFLQSPDVRTARHTVRSTLSTKHHSQWSDDEKNQASLVCANYDVAAGLMREKMAPVDIFVTNWGPSIIHCHEVLSPYMSEIRSKPGGHPEYWRNFDWLRAQVTNNKH
ncbi:MAG: hypothetical protein KGZ83_03220 [Sulfuricella sp.]|nr:hypothetical protein [Sulfuricella sp.]